LQLLRLMCVSCDMFSRIVHFDITFHVLKANVYKEQLSINHVNRKMRSVISETCIASFIRIYMETLIRPNEFTAMNKWLM
jgi:hypothetical protein